MTDPSGFHVQRLIDDGFDRRYRQPDAPQAGDADASGPTGGPGSSSAAGRGDGNNPAPVDPTDRSKLFVNREESWLQFNRRVLQEAQDATNPLLERVKFLAISSTNLDEFFEIRVAGVMELVEAGLHGENPDGLSPLEELDRIRVDAHAFTAEMHRTWHDLLLPELARAGIEFKALRQLTDKQRKWVDRHFKSEIYPILTPLAVDRAHPFPVLLNKSLNVAVLLQDPRQPRRTPRMAVVQVPRTLPRIQRVPELDGSSTWVFTAEIVRSHLSEQFPGLDVVHATTFRVTRDSNIDVDEFQSTDLMTSIEKELIKRRRGEPVRLEVDQDAHPDIVERFVKAFGLEADDVYHCDGPVNLGRILELYSIVEAPELKDAPAQPRRSWSWPIAGAMFADLREGDILLHHPYDSFSTVEDFVRLAAHDPKVMAIKQTIYRAGSKSPMVEALIEAAQQRKQVTAIIELKARFDEEANIQWARRMEKAGVHVVYGIVDLKTHAKCTLVVRREDDGFRRYCHLGTGNYNPTTARFYTDVGLMTANPEIGEEVAETFNMITGHTRVPVMQHLLVAPYALRDKVLDHIKNEIRNAKAGKHAAIRAKLNNLVDPQVILALYEASRAGVQIDLCIRSVCCLRPGVPGLSDNIRVVAIVDRFLEHSRVFSFENAGDPQVYLSSADWMIRNLDRRVEVAFPVLDPVLKQRVVEEVLDASLNDNVKARRILADGKFERIEHAEGDTPRRSQVMLLELTRQPEATGESPQPNPRKRRKKKKRG